LDCYYSSLYPLQKARLTVTTDATNSKILLIEIDPAAANAIRIALADSPTGPFDVQWVSKLSLGLERLAKKDIDAVLFELSLSDSQGLESFDKLHAAAPEIPILILGGDGDEALAQQAVARGAQDYLLPGHLDSYSLSRALRNAIERKAVENALHVEKERALVTLNSIGDAVLCTDISGKVSYLNLVAESMTGWRREDAIGQPLATVFRIIDGTTREPARNPLEMAVEENRTVGLTVNCILIPRDGIEIAIEDSAAPIHDRAGRVIGAVIVFHNVGAARAMSLEVTHAAQHDILTKLPNRVLLNDRISQAIALARRQHRPIAVMFLDLDHFKAINDSLGHAAGDELLRSVSKRLVADVRRSDTVSRQGGDEFVVLLSEITRAEDAAASANKILASLAAPHSIGGKDQNVNLSLGISIYPEDGEDPETLIQNADMAMYHAKESGRHNFKFFKAEMNLQAVERQSLESSLRRAIEREEFILHYQPKVSLETGEITGVEALIRWQHPDRGLVPPGEFVPVAEQCGLIRDIGRWVLRESSRQARAWQDAGLPPLPIAVNISACEFRDKSFLESLQNIISETGLEARRLELELKGGALMKDAKSTASILQELKMMGVRLAVDDFGTGYSSLSYLRQFPIDILKIDQSFVQQITADRHDSTIVGAIINIGKSLGQLVVAEGVETREQQSYLKAQKCAEGQGYLFCRPLVATEFACLLQRGMIETAVH
jgi:diguanylate cyclase (GGDEF)-like protein/PAS domain S-box-containing protein